MTDDAAPSADPEQESFLTAKGKLKSSIYEQELARLQIELAKLQAWFRRRA